MEGNFPMEFLTQWKQITFEMLIIWNLDYNENKAKANMYLFRALTTTRNTLLGIPVLNQMSLCGFFFDSNMKPHMKSIV